MIRNTPILILLISSFALHGIVLLWPTSDSVPTSSPIAPDSGIQLYLKPHSPNETSVSNQSRDAVTSTRKQSSQVQRKRTTKQPKLVKNIRADKELLSEVAKEPLSRSAPATVTTLTHPTAPPVIQAASPSMPTEADVQQLRLRIQQLIKLRVSHNQHYPRIARKRAWEGQVKLGMQVRADGQLTGIHVIASSGHRVLDKAAMKSVRIVTHLPEAIDWLQGENINVILPVIYKLTDS